MVKPPPAAHTIDLRKFDSLCAVAVSGGQPGYHLAIFIESFGMSGLHDPTSLLDSSFGPGAAPRVISVPGRVNLIGEHIDYHNLPVLPMAIGRRVRIAFRPRGDAFIRAVSAGPYGERQFVWERQLEPGPSGDWSNYVKAAAQAVGQRWEAGRGLDAAVVSDLPPAAGLSSSSAVLTGFTLALLQVNGICATFEELMEILPEAEHFVGTRGGGMDHAAVLAARAGSAVLVRFVPPSATPVKVPWDWAFLIAHSLTGAEKSGAVRAEYNARRTAGASALQRLGFSTYAQLLESHGWNELKALADGNLEGRERGCFLHVASEALRVRQAVAAMEAADAELFGDLLDASHESLREWLQVSTAALNDLVAAARDAGALGARLTGAGFGGCAVVFCRAAELDRVRSGLVRRYYSRRSGFDAASHLIAAQPSAGALYV